MFKNELSGIGSYLYGYISRLVWVTPAILLIIKYKDKLRYKTDELFSHPAINKSFIIITLVSLFYVVVMMFITHKGVWFNKDIVLGLVILKYIFVGTVEELIFRGWGYNALSNYMPHNKAAAISTLFFILLHFPSYFIKLYRFGTFDFTGILGQSSTLIFGSIFCYLLKKSNNIYTPILVHTIYDLAYVLLVGGA